MLTLETPNHMLTDDDVDATPDYDIRGKSWRARKRAHASVSFGQVGLGDFYQVDRLGPKPHRKPTGTTAFLSW